MSERPYDWDAKEREATEHIRRQTAELRDELSKPSIQDQLTAAQARVAELEQLLGASLDMMNRMLPRIEVENKECQLIKAEIRKALNQ